MPAPGLRRTIVAVYAGQVQGIGFRPYVYRLAARLGVDGTVANSRRGLILVAQGRNAGRLIRFVRDQPPRLARIESVTVTRRLARPLCGFSIVRSRESGARLVDVLPDLAVCAECGRDVNRAGDRRRAYAFTNCTQCGPRYSIVEALPYDRPKTTMRRFPMCPDCRAEYYDPKNRRFHAQPNACPVCGPKLTLLDRRGRTMPAPDPLLAAARALAAGSIVAVKSIGGFQLACDATSSRAVERLRQRKQRPRKPLAVMCAHIAAVRKLCRVSRSAQTLLRSAAAPIVLMPKLARPTQSVADSVAPDNSRLGVMLAYTPLHLLLLQRLRQITGAEPVLVMTSANPRDEPIIGDDRELALRLGSVYNLALTHDRPIANRCDDSVVLDGLNNGSALIRRARGYAPQPVALAPMFHVKQPVLAVGAEWKNCFCLASGGRAYLSPHIGSVATEQGERLWRDTLARYQSWTGIKPKAIACDLHPDYLSTRLAEQLASGLGLPLIRVQHHFAHVLSVLAESGAAGPVLGVACDGTGYGSDGATWGCEFLLVGQDLAWSRVGMLDSLRLADAGAETADPHRTGQAYLAQSQEPGSGPGVYPRRVSCSSLGRLFDAAAGITAICRHATYDAEAAVALESRADPKETADWFSPELLNFTLSPARIDPRPVIRQVSRETTAGAPVSAVAARFQNTLVRLISHFALGLCHRHGTKTVALSGGSFQNQRLLAGVGTRLGQAGLAVLANRLVPANDAGIALGQVVATQPSADDSGRRKTA